MCYAAMFVGCKVGGKTPTVRFRCLAGFREPFDLFHILKLTVSLGVDFSNLRSSGLLLWAFFGCKVGGKKPTVTVLISHQVILKSFRKSQFQHKFVDLSFIISDMKNKLTNLCGN